MDSMSKWRRENETPYLVGCRPIPSTVNILLTSFLKIEIQRDNKSPDSSDRARSSDDESLPESDSDGDDDGNLTPSQDEENLLPDDSEEATSPIDDIKNFDWGEFESFESLTSC